MTVPPRIVPVGQCDCGGGGRGAGVAERPEERPLGAARHNPPLPWGWY